MKDLTIVVPCYNEASRGTIKRLEENVNKIALVLGKTKYDFDILLFDDCSNDNTLELIKKICEKNDKVKYLFHKKNIGRGGTVSDGIKDSNSKIVGFIDIDLSTSPHYILPLVIEIEKGADIATGENI